MKTFIYVILTAFAVVLSSCGTNKPLSKDISPLAELTIMYYRGLGEVFNWEDYVELGKHQIGNVPVYLPDKSKIWNWDYSIYRVKDGVYIRGAQGPVHFPDKKGFDSFMKWARDHGKGVFEFKETSESHFHPSDFLAYKMEIVP